MELDSRDIQREAVLRLITPLLTALSRALFTIRNWAEAFSESFVAISCRDFLISVLSRDFVSTLRWCRFRL